MKLNILKLEAFKDGEDIFNVDNIIDSRFKGLDSFADLDVIHTTCIWTKFINK